MQPIDGSPMSGTFLTIAIILGCFAAARSFAMYLRRRAVRGRGTGAWQNDPSTFGQNGGGHRGHHGGGWGGGDGGHHGGGGGDGAGGGGVGGGHHG